MSKKIITLIKYFKLSIIGSFMFFTVLANASAFSFTEYKESLVSKIANSKIWCTNALLRDYYKNDCFYVSNNKSVVNPEIIVENYKKVTEKNITEVIEKANNELKKLEDKNNFYASNQYVAGLTPEPE